MWPHHLIDKRFISPTWFIFFACINFFLLFHHCVFSAEAHFEIHALNIRRSSTVNPRCKAALSISPSIVVKIWVKEKFTITILVKHRSKFTLLQLIHITIRLLATLARTLYTLHWFFLLSLIVALSLLVRQGMLLYWEIKLLRFLCTPSLSAANILCRRILIYLKLALN